MNNRTAPDSYETVARSEFGDHLREVAMGWKAILAVSVATALALGALGFRAPALFEANVVLLAVTDTGTDGDAEFRAEQAAEIATTRAALERAGERSGLDLTGEGVESQVTLALRDTPGFIQVTVQAENASEAVILAKAVGDLIVEEARDRNAVVQIVDPARTDNEPISGSPIPGAILAGLATAILTAELLIASRKLRGRLSPVSPAADIERILDVPGIAVGSTRRASDVESMVPFFAKTLSDRPVITVMQHGKVGDARIAGHLGVIAGRFHKRVLMVDADVNGASLHRQFSLERSPGLAEVLEGSARLRESLNRVDSDSSTVLLSAGAPSLDGLSGPARVKATEQVVISAAADTAFVSVTSGSTLDDALVCVHQFPSAVVLVVDPDGLRVADLRRVADQIRGVGGRLVGVITAPAQSLTAPAQSR